MKNLSPTEALQFCKKGAFILDVRMDYLSAYKKFDVENTLYIPINQLNDRISEIFKNKTIIIADSVGLQSKEAYKIISSSGFNNIYNMAGGLIEWERDGLPVKIDIKQRLTGSCMCQLRPRENKK